jgi:diamine N-acetyltransferase
LLQIQRAASVAALPHIYPPELYPFPDDDVRRRWGDFRGRVFVAERDARAVGLAGIDGCWLHGLYVVPDEWGTGVAVALHDHALASMDGWRVAHLWVLEENHRARRFYERRGWRLNGETRIVPFPPNPLDVGYSRTL